MTVVSFFEKKNQQFNFIFIMQRVKIFKVILNLYELLKCKVAESMTLSNLTLENQTLKTNYIDKT